MTKINFQQKVHLTDPAIIFASFGGVGFQQKVHLTDPAIIFASFGGVG